MNWLKAINDSTSPERLLAVVNEYLLGLPEEHWSCIPREARPRLVATVEELDGWHRRLAGTIAEASSPNIRLLDLAVFFMRASSRAAEMGAHAQRADTTHQ